jgi:hypothetical protein
MPSTRVLACCLAVLLAPSTAGERDGRKIFISADIARLLSSITQ